MATKSFKRMTPMYKALGLATSTDLISRRIASAQKAYDDVDEPMMPSLVRVALGLAKQEEEVPFVAYFSDDAAFDPQPKDREVAGLAAVILWELIESSKNLGATTALAVATAGYGGLRKYIDVELQQFAESSLASYQAADRAGPPEKVTYQGKPKLKDDFDQLDQRGPNNQLNIAYANLKNILQSGITYTETGLKDLATQMISILENQKRLDEEMSIHWWIVGGWSTERGMSFSALSLSEAVLRAGKELSDLTKSDVGMLAAPGMIDIVLKAGRSGELGSISIGEIATTAGLDWRNGRQTSQSIVQPQA